MSKLSRNILYNLAGQGSLLILNALAVRYVFRQLGEDAFGIIYFTLVMSTVLAGVLELGINATTVREVSAHVHEDPDYVRDLIRTASTWYWLLYVLLAAGVYFGAPILVGKWIHVKTIDPGTATHALRLLGPSALLVLPRSLYASLLRGLQRMGLSNAIDIAAVAIQQLGVILILSLGGDLSRVLYWLSASFGLHALGYVGAASRLFSWKAMVPGYVATVVRRNLGYASTMMSVSVLSVIHRQADKIMLSKLLPIGTFAYYAFASGMISQATLLTGAIAQAALPAFSAALAGGDRSEAQARYRRLHDLLCIASVPIVTAILFGARPFLAYLFNAQVAHQLLLPMVFLCLGSYMNATLTIPSVHIIASGQADIIARSNFLALFTVLPATAALIMVFGLAGAGFSWFLYHLFTYAYLVPRACLECLDISAGEWYKHVVRILAVAVGTYGPAWILLDVLKTQTVFALSVAYVGASAAFLAAAYMTIPRERRVKLLRWPYALRETP